MGRRVRHVSNPALAQPHAAGAKVSIIQVLVHKEFGAIGYPLPHYWEYHLAFASEAAQELRSLQNNVLHITPGSHNGRMVDDEALLKQVYRTGNDMVSHSVRAAQHLSEEVERVHRKTLEGSTTLERVREAAALFSSTDYRQDQDYPGLCEIVQIRDAVEHPQQSNTYATVDRDWAVVPLAWFLSDRSAMAWNQFASWFRRLSDDWDRSPKPFSGTVTVVVERGIQSLHQVKKPPRSRNV
jgi:hypothetical protein